MCDSDKNCKGYVKSDHNCLVATISTCQHGCVKYAKGMIGDLVMDSTSGGNSSYEGCFIKLSGNSWHISKQFSKFYDQAS